MATNQSNTKTAVQYARDIAEMWNECVADEVETLELLTTMTADEYDWDETVPEDMREEVWRILQALWTRRCGECVLERFLERDSGSPPPSPLPDEEDEEDVEEHCVICGGEIGVWCGCIADSDEDEDTFQRRLRGTDEPKETADPE